MKPKFVFQPILILALAFVLTGSTCNKQRTAFNSIATVEQAADGSIKAYLDLVAQGNVSTNDVPKVMRQYDVVQLGVRTALIAFQGNSNAVAPAQLLSDAEELQGLITAVKGK